MPIPPQEGVANQLTPVFSQLVPDWFAAIGKVGGKSIGVLSITNVHTPIISENMPVAWSPAVTFLIQGKQTLTESATGLEEVAKWLQSLGIWSKPLEATQLADLQDKGEVIAEVRGVPSLVRLTTVTQGILPSAEISRGRQVMAQSNLLPDQTMKALTSQFGAVQALPRSLSPEAMAGLFSRLKDLDTQGPKAMLIVDPETAEQIKTVLAEVDPEWKVPVLIVGVPRGLLDATDSEVVLAYLLNLLAQVDQIPGRHIERLEAAFTLEAKHQTLFLSSGA